MLFNRYEVQCKKAAYFNGTPAIFLIYWDDDLGVYAPYGSATVNLGTSIPNDCVVLDENNLQGISEFLSSIGAGSDTGLRILSGFCEYPVFRLNLEWYNSLNPYK